MIMELKALFGSSCMHFCPVNVIECAMIGQIFQPITKKAGKRSSTEISWELVHLEHGGHPQSYMVVWRVFYSFNALVKELKDISCFLESSRQVY